MSNIIEIRNAALEARILSLGATLTGLHFAGTQRNLVLGFADPADQARIPTFAGHLAGPVANRVRAGRAQIDGQTHQMPLNENGQTTLHSGPEGLHAQDWHLRDQGVAHVTLTCTLPDGTNGLPGNREITARYELSNSTLRLSVTATSDQTTPINIASHPYWNLDGAGDVSGHTLQIAADHFLPIDAQTLPTGDLAPLKGSPFDFRRAALVPLDPALDLNFCLTAGVQDSPQPAATLRGRDGTTLTIATTCPGLQVYAGAKLPDLPVAMAGSPALAPYAGIALEPQHWPDALHHNHFPSILIHPGQPYHQITEYLLSQG